MLITISVGSIVITMLMSILSSSLLTKNLADHENRLLEESYYISEYIQNRVADLGVRSIEGIEDIEELSTIETEDQILRVNHEWDLKIDFNGVVYRDYDSAESFILHYDSSEQSIHYGSDEFFDYQNLVFINPDETKINSGNVTVESGILEEQVDTLSFTCISESDFKNADSDVDGTADRKCSSAIINLDIVLNYRINDDPLFKSMRFETTIVF
jgi:hypothetical protein